MVEYHKQPNFIKYNSCNSCGATKNIDVLTVGMCYDFTSIALCQKCKLELINKLANKQN